MIVVDLGCATYPEFPEDESVNRLIERFRPDVLYGFDPNPATQKSRSQGDTLVVIEQKAAWIYDGFVGYVEPPAVLNPLRCYTAEQAGPAAVPCFDLNGFLEGLPEDMIVLKMDVEGAEYPLLERLIQQDLDVRLSLLLVEWHEDHFYPGYVDETGEVHVDDEARARDLIDLLRCPVEAW